MLTQNDAQTAYTTARDEVLKIVRSYNATEEQIKTAEKIAKKLATDFIGKQFVTFDELTKNYQDFIQYMKHAISDLQKGGPIEAVTKLKDVLGKIEPVFSDDDDEEEDSDS